jgi:NADH dehydrogenase FAD-containing subunit
MEIRAFSKEKKITIIEANDRLIRRMSPKSSSYALKLLEKNNITVHFNERISKSDPSTQTYYSDKAEYKAQFVYWSSGIKPNIDIFDNKEMLDERGFVKVKDKPLYNKG